MASSTLQTKSTVVRNSKWAALIFCYQWAAWALIGGVPSLWPDVVMPVLRQLHDTLLPPLVFYTLIAFVPMAAYFLMIYRSNICRRKPAWFRVLVSFVIVYPLWGLTSGVVYRVLDATGWFPFFDAGSKPLNA